MAWLYSLMLSGLRDQVLDLACLRHGVPSRQGRGLDDLPSELTRSLEPTLVQEITGSEMKRAFSLTAELLKREIEHTDPTRASVLDPILTQLVGGQRKSS